MLNRDHGGQPLSVKRLENDPAAQVMARKHVSGLGRFFFNLNFIRVELIYNVVLVSSEQQCDSIIHIHVFILFQILFSYRLSENTE